MQSADCLPRKAGVACVGMPPASRGQSRLANCGRQEDPSRRGGRDPSGEGHEAAGAASAGSVPKWGRSPWRPDRVCGIDQQAQAGSADVEQEATRPTWNPRKLPIAITGRVPPNHHQMEEQ